LPSFLCDEHISPRLAARLRERGVSAAHVFDFGLTSADDLVIWQWARDTTSIIVTKDRRFAAMAAARLGPAVVLVRLGNCSTTKLSECFLAALPRIAEEIDSGARLIELR
jgi:predicted nuclease of predicted toxin-antitoxin system